MRNNPVRLDTGNRHRRGVAIFYIIVMMVVVIGMVSLGVDLARVRLAKGELQTAADAAARYGASFLTNGTTAVQNAAIATAANYVNGATLTLSASDVTVGTWNSTTKVFTAGGASPNAVRVTANKTAGSGIPLMFASIIGQSRCNVSASAIAILQAGSGSTQRINGIMNLYLAGMANGNYGGADVWQTAPTNSPVQATGITLTAGQVLTFSVTGSTADDPVNINQNWTPDGQPGGLRTNDSGYLNGMSQLTAQQASLVGVFLTNSAPNSGGTPAALNFSTAASRDYTSLSPALKQPFFIGDGKRNNGTTLHQVVVPAGATRLFLGTHDNINWGNNSGYYMVTINGAAAKIVSVK